MPCATVGAATARYGLHVHKHIVRKHDDSNPTASSLEPNPHAQYKSTVDTYRLRSLGARIAPPWSHADTPVVLQ